MTATIDPKLLAQMGAATGATGTVRAYVQLRAGAEPAEQRAAKLIDRVSRATRVPAEHYYNGLLEKVLVTAPAPFYEALLCEPEVASAEAALDLGSSAKMEPIDPKPVTPDAIDRPVRRRRGRTG